MTDVHNQVVFVTLELFSLHLLLVSKVALCSLQTSLKSIVSSWLTAFNVSTLAFKDALCLFLDCKQCPVQWTISLVFYSKILHKIHNLLIKIQDLQFKICITNTNTNIFLPNKFAEMKSFPAVLYTQLVCGMQLLHTCSTNYMYLTWMLSRFDISKFHCEKALIFSCSEDIVWLAFLKLLFACLL